MTLNEWHAFNKSILAFGTYNVKVFKTRSYHINEVELNSDMCIDTAVKFFGDYEIRTIKIDSKHAFPIAELSLWPIDKKEEE